VLTEHLPNGSLPRPAARALSRLLARAVALPGLLAALALTALALGACESSGPKVQTPARLLYLEGQSLADQGLYSEAITKFQQVADQNPGTLLGSHAYLQIAELRSEQQDWVPAETSYRLFLNANQQSHLTPYVLHKLVKVNHSRSYTGVLFSAREIDRDVQPNRQIILEYQRFFFLYPNSVFLDEVRGYALSARETLAEHERMVGDWYFQRGHYQAAATRYAHLLRHYPSYPHAEDVVARLILAYRRNLQPELADELERVRTARADGPHPDPADGGRRLAGRPAGDGG
jgi:outer membrane protein assembly factor BamD